MKQKFDSSQMCQIIGQVVRQVSYINTSDWVRGGGPYYGPNIPYANDDLFFPDHRVYSGNVISHQMRIKDVVGIPPYLKLQDNPTFVHHTSKPQGFKWDGREDYARYGSRLTLLSSLAHNTASVETNAKVIKRQKCVTHAAYNGNVDACTVDVLYNRPISNQIEGLPIAIRGYEHVAGKVQGDGCQTFMSLDQNRLGDISFDVRGGGGTFSPGFDQFEYVGSLANHINTAEGGVHTRSNYYGWDLTYSNVVDNSHVDSVTGSTWIDVSYRYDMHSPTGHDVSWDVHINICMTWIPSVEDQGPFVENGFRSISSSCLKIADLSSVTYVPGSVNWFYLNPVLTDLYGQVSLSRNLFFYSVPSDMTLGIQGGFALLKHSFRPLGAKDRVIRNREKFLMERFEADLPNLRPSSFLAASDALEKLDTILDSNWLQNLQHLKDVLSILPDLKGLGEILAKYNDGDVSVVIDIVDYLTQAVLKWNFQQKPIIRDGRQILEKDLLKSIKSLSQPRTYTIYGKYVYVFEDSECYIKGDKQRLETRAEIRIRVDLGSLLTTALVANSLGFWPSLARLWSLVPFSFVVDWFTNMSERLLQVDNQIAWLGFTTEWCVYSYKLFHFPSWDELNECGLQDRSFNEIFSNTAYQNAAFSDDLTQFSLSVYQRELSLIMPRLWDSPYDFLKRTSQPKPLVVGSLLWQLI